MAKVGDLFRPGEASPEVGVYQCSGTGCTSTFKASVRGTPFPPAHHGGAMWKLTQVSVPAAAAAPASTASPYASKPPAPTGGTKPPKSGTPER